ncbi:MAG: hypothetical protein OXN86_09730 [Chloroflexota bacterium]|nr:hypothetical protein [Chloroflexota bacterium]
MGSRVGSIAILMVIGGIVAAVVIVISRLDLLDTGEPDAPVMVLSIDEGELVLLNEPLSITVTISSGNPIATLELFADEVSIASILPAYSADRGAFIGSFVWTPDRLGFADVRVVALDDQGVESSRTIRVEVTDDQARVAAALRVQVLGIAPLQQFVAGTEIHIAISATGNQEIERFDMLVNGEFQASITPVRNEDGQYIAAFFWTHDKPGEVEVTIVAIDVSGRREAKTIPVILIPQDGSTPATEADEQVDPDSQRESSTPGDQADTGIGVALIESPEDGERFTLDADLSIDVKLAARNVGAVASALLYITPVAPDNTLGSSVLIHSSEGHAPGDYSERIADVERWITSSGSYELQLVVFTPDDERYDDRIMIHIVAVADRDDGSSGDAQQDDAPPASDEIDLAIVTARQADDDRQRLNVSITNQSTVDIERTDVVITVVDARDGAELASAAVTLGIESDALRTIPLDLDLEPGVDVEAFVLLEALADTDTSNNRLSITLTAPPEGQPEQGGEQQSEQQESQDRPDPAGPSPDLTFLDVQATNDGYILMTVINSGAGTAETFFIVITDQSGEQLETISRRDGDAQSLGPGETQILTSLQPHSGTVDITVVVGGDSVEQELDNNRVTFQIPG